MTRPHKHRHILGQPPVVVYKPAGVPARGLTWITLTLDEYEAIRLIDYLGQNQETAAAAMGVSRPTVTRIYQSARGKIARVLVQGDALMIEGGPVVHIDEPPAAPQDSQDFSQGMACGHHRHQGQGMGGRGFGRGQGRNQGRGRRQDTSPGDM